MSTVSIADGHLQLTVPFGLTADEMEFVHREWLRVWAENGRNSRSIGIDAERIGEDLVVSFLVR